MAESCHRDTLFASIHFHVKIKNDVSFIAIISLLLFVIKAIFVIFHATGPAVLNDEYLYKFNAESMFLLQKYANAHYPPAYSLALIPAFFFDNWYPVMLVINAILSSLVVPATWALAKAAEMRHPLVPAALAALIPFHAVYPSFLLSENLFVPLFCCTLALCLRGHSASPLQGFLFGLAAGLTHLTKYLFLPAMPLLFFGWLWGIRNSRRNHGNGRPWIAALTPFLAYLAIIALWVWYGQASGFHWRQLFGLDISAAGRLVTDSGHALKTLDQFASVSSFLMWLSAYAAYLTLLWLPIWGLGGTWALDALSGRKKFKISDIRRIFFVLAFALVLGYCLTAVLHSFGGEYNYPIPKRILGRYLIHLFPIMLVLASLVLESFSDRKILPEPRSFAFGACLSLMLGLVAWSVIRGDIWNFPSFFHKNQVNLLNISAMGPAIYLTLAFMAALLPMWLTRKSSGHPNVLAAPLALFFICSTLAYAWAAPYRQEGLNLRMIAAAANEPQFHGKEVLVLVDKVPVPANGFMDSPRFWGLRNTKVMRVQDAEGLRRFRMEQSPKIFITSRDINLSCLKRYSFKQKEYKIFLVDQYNITELEIILSEFEKSFAAKNLEQNTPSDSDQTEN